MDKIGTDIEKVLSGYPSIYNLATQNAQAYHENRLFFSKEEIERSIQKAAFTTECPKCHQTWTREEYLEMPIGCIVLMHCPSCESVGVESVTLVGNNKVWESSKTSNL